MVRDAGSWNETRVTRGWVIELWNETLKFYAQTGNTASILESLKLGGCVRRQVWLSYESYGEGGPPPTCDSYLMYI